MHMHVCRYGASVEMWRLGDGIETESELESESESQSGWVGGNFDGNSVSYYKHIPHWYKTHTCTHTQRYSQRGVCRHNNKYFVVKCFCFNAPQNTAQIDWMIVRPLRRLWQSFKYIAIHIYIHIWTEYV